MNKSIFVQFVILAIIRELLAFTLAPALAIVFTPIIILIKGEPRRRIKKAFQAPAVYRSAFNEAVGNYLANHKR